MKKLIIILSAAIVLLAGVLFLLKDGIRDYIKGQRAQVLYEEALTAREAGNLEEASRKAVAAYYQDSSNADYILTTAQLRLELRMEDSLDWWQLALESGVQLPKEDLQFLIRLMLANDQIEDSNPFLMYLITEYGDDEVSQQIWLDSLRQRNQFRVASGLAQQFARGADSWVLHQQYLDLKGEGDLTIQAYLEGLLDNEGDLSRLAALELLTRPDMPNPTIRKALEVVQDPEDNLEELVILGGRLRLGDIDASVVQARILELIEAGDVELVTSISNWLVYLGDDWLDWFTGTVDIETYVEWGGRRDFYWFFLVQQDKWERIMDLTQTDEELPPLDKALRFYYRGLAQENLGEGEEGRANILLAASVVPLEEADKLESLLKRSGDMEAIQQLLGRQLEASPENQQVLNRNLMIAYLTGDQDRLLSLMDRLSEYDRKENSWPFQAFQAYLDLIFSRDAESIHQELEENYAQFPEFADYRMLLALSWKIRGNPEAAEALIEDMPALGDTSPRHFKIIQSIVKGSSYPGSGRQGELLPRERYLLHLAG